VRRAREVVGLYGDPSVTWGICVDLGFAESVVTEEIPARLAALVDAHPHLGRVPRVVSVPESRWQEAVRSVASDPFGDCDSLVRIATSVDGRRLLVGAHHGACDGLGLLAVANAVTDAGISSEARGIGDRSAERPFLLSSARRLGEALLAPPARFRGTRRPGEVGERFLRRDLPAVRAGTATVAHAISEAFATWRRERRVSGRRPLVSFGASRRPANQLQPDRQTAYFRLPFDPAWTAEEFSDRIAALDPEPVFPETSAGGVGPRVTRALRNRLGATAIISNLGRLGGPGLVSAAMYPAASGPHAVAFGFATTPERSTLTLRNRRSDFTDEESRALVTAVADRLAGRGAQ
jgi:hypothetical protein